jgi:hypothetical protein
MMKDVNDIEAWVETANCFEVMGQLRRLGVLTREDVKMAMRLKRPEWLAMMKEKIGITPETKNEGDCI